MNAMSLPGLRAYGKGVDHGLETQINLFGSNDLGNVLLKSVAMRAEEHVGKISHTLGSFGSRRATLIPSSLKSPFAWARYRGAWYGVACLASVSTFPAKLFSNVPPIGQERDFVRRHVDAAIVNTSRSTHGKDWRHVPAQALP